MNYNLLPEAQKVDQKMDPREFRKRQCSCVIKLTKLMRQLFKWCWLKSFHASGRQIYRTSQRHVIQWLVAKQRNTAKGYNSSAFHGTIKRKQIYTGPMSCQVYYQIFVQVTEFLTFWPFLKSALTTAALTTAAQTVTPWVDKWCYTTGLISSQLAQWTRSWFLGSGVVGLRPARMMMLMTDQNVRCPQHETQDNCPDGGITASL